MLEAGIAVMGLNLYSGENRSMGNLSWKGYEKYALV